MSARARTGRTTFRVVCQKLETAKIPFALCDATALSAWGVARATQDLALLVADARALSADLWADLGGPSATVSVGDDDDPLLGVVRVGPRATRPVDVILPRGSWVAPILQRASLTVRLDGIDVPVVAAADLVLLKLYAGGFFDQRDIATLLGSSSSAEVRALVDERVSALPRDARALWGRLRDERL